MNQTLLYQQFVVQAQWITETKTWKKRRGQAKWEGEECSSLGLSEPKQPKLGGCPTKPIQTYVEVNPFNY